MADRPSGEITTDHSTAGPKSPRIKRKRPLLRLWLASRDLFIILAAGALLALIGLGGYGFALGATTAGFVLVSLKKKHGKAARFFQFAFGYWLLWMLFHDARAIADSTPWVSSVQDWVWRFERAIFGGELPNARLQRELFDPAQTSPFDYVLVAIYLSFFFVSLIVGMVIAWKNWALARHMLIAKAIMLTIGFVIIFALPTTPPWLSPDSALVLDQASPERVYRITAIARGQEEGYHFEQDDNALAAMPSIHMATTMLVLFLAFSYRRRWRIVAGVYISLMGFAIVYLGEHYVLDEIAGIALAIGSWQLAYLWGRRWESRAVCWYRGIKPDFSRPRRVLTPSAEPAD